MSRDSATHAKTDAKLKVLYGCVDDPCLQQERRTSNRYTYIGNTAADSMLALCNSSRTRGKGMRLAVGIGFRVQDMRGSDR
jgi:hypothetical protein